MKTYVKKFVSIVLTVLMAVTVLPSFGFSSDFSALASSWPVTDVYTYQGDGYEISYYYEYKDNGSDITIRRCVPTDGKTSLEFVPEIPSQIDGKPVKEIYPGDYSPYYAFSDFENIKEVNFPGSIETLKNLFHPSTKIQKIVLNNGVKRLEKHSVSNCTSTENLTIPSSVEYIGEQAFYGSCFNKITVNGSNVIFGESAFSGFAGNEIDIKQELTALPKYMFNSCQNITELNLHGNIEIIGEGAFATCSNLKRINLESEPKVIGRYAFTFCSKLENCYEVIGSKVESIGGYAFEYVPNFKFDFSKCKNLKEISGAAFVRTYYEKFVFPEGVTVTDALDFRYCRNLKEIVIPENVKIGEEAFVGCDSLKEITLPLSSSNDISKYGIGYKSLISDPVKYNDFTLKFYCDSPEAKKTFVKTYHGEDIYSYNVRAYVDEFGINYEEIHHEKAVDGVAPTCEKTGLTESIVCESCGKVISDHEVVPATGHIAVKDEAVAPTCEKDGLTEGRHCKTCGKVLLKQKVISKTGHVDKDNDGFCDNCNENMAAITGCTCICHNQSRLAVFICKILTALGKPFGFFKSCKCGHRHY